jgi:hypothetical protein
MTTDTKVDQLLVNILSTRRADQTAGDTNFRLWLQTVLQSLKTNAQILSRGNIYVTVGESKTLFSCHIDTCHSINESTGQPQEIQYDPNMEHIFLPKGTNSSCLGADDGAGIYIMLKMIQANIAGGYIFHTGEERGGLGAKEVLKHHVDILKKYDRAIAFDRPNTDEVIITQGGTSCASANAGNALAAALNKHGLDYKISTKGVFTDTKVYNTVIPECFNLGVGYMFQHTPDESLDYGHLKALLKACLSINWEALPVLRKLPKVEANPFQCIPKPKLSLPNKAKQPSYYELDLPDNKLENVYDELFEYSLDEFENLVEVSPFIAAVNMAKLVAKVKSLEAENEQLYVIMGLN